MQLDLIQAALLTLLFLRAKLFCFPTNTITLDLMLWFSISIPQLQIQLQWTFAAILPLVLGLSIITKTFGLRFFLELLPIAELNL
jgi:hypothetical protein